MKPVVFVTGACGFVGTWVVRELLSRNAKVVAIDHQPIPDRWERVIGDERENITYAQTEITDRDTLLALMNQHDVTHVIHLAALLTPACQADPFEGCRVNILGSTALFDAARLTGRITAISYASSYAVYGESSDPTENEPPTFYGAFKQSVDLIAKQYWEQFQIASLAIRPHIVYGAERDMGLTAGPSLACRAAALEEPYQINYSGSGGYDFVEDVSTAFVRAAFECPPGAHVVNLPSQAATPRDFVEQITAQVPAAAKLLTHGGPEIPVNISPVSKDIRDILSDWKATDLSEGIRRTIKFYQQRS